MESGSRQDKTVSSVVLSAIVFTPPTRTRQFCHVRVGGVNKSLSRVRCVHTFQRRLLASVGNSSATKVQRSLSSSSSKINGSNLLGRCMLPVFRRRARDMDSTNGAHIVTLDTRQPMSGSAATIVESMSAEFTGGDQHHSEAGAPGYQLTRHSQTANVAQVRKSQSLHNSTVTLSYLSCDRLGNSTSPTHDGQCPQQQQRCLLTQQYHSDDDDDDDDGKLRTSVNGHHNSVQSSESVDRQHSVRELRVLRISRDTSMHCTGYITVTIAGVASMSQEETIMYITCQIFGYFCEYAHKIALTRKKTFSHKCSKILFSGQVPPGPTGGACSAPADL